jgi:hypothetical protein
MGRLACIWLTTILTVHSLLHAQSTRQEERLTTGWESVVAPVAAKLPESGWAQIRVPYEARLLPSDPPQARWFRRELLIPDHEVGRRYFIDLRGARNEPRVYVDGRQIEGTGAGWTPEQVEITDAVRAGGRHLLCICCCGRSSAPGKLLYPVGGQLNSVGLTDQVILRSTNASYIDARELEIVPSTRKRTLSISGIVRGFAGSMVIGGDVLDSGQSVLKVSDRAVSADGHFAMEIPFPEAHFWSPEDPHLYLLRLQLRDSTKAVDELSTRFGFKEIWTEGSDFYLNGVKRHLLGTATWPVPNYIEPAEIRRRLALIRQSNTIIFRLHTGPWPEAWLDAADEVGLLIIDETGLYTDTDGRYAYDDPRFWQNCRQHITGMIQRDRNHACLAMFSLGNEILFMGNGKRHPAIASNLGDLARAAREVDPHHPLTMEADLDPDGAFDVIGLHYPHEMPWNFDYPNTADWLGARTDAEAGGGMLGQQEAKGFFWKRDKPLYIGEYLWLPQGDYSCSTIWFGDDAFINREGRHLAARDLAWRDQTIAFRRSGVSGMCPWTMLPFGADLKADSPEFAAEQDFYRPVAAYWKTKALRFFSGGKAAVDLDVFNDSPVRQSLSLVIHCVGDPKPISSVEQINLEPGGYQLVSLPLQLPQVSEPTDLLVESQLSSGANIVHAEQHRITIVPDRPFSVPAGARLVIYDPTGRWSGALHSLKNLATISPESTVLLVAENVLPAAGEANPPALRDDLSALRQLVASGARAVVLEQDDLSALGIGLNTEPRRSTMSFALQPKHPLLKGLHPEDLRFWAADNYVTRNEIVRPDSNGALAIAVTGGQDWLNYAPIVELPYGRGRFVCIQLMAGEKRSIEPAASMLIQNAVDYLAAVKPSAESTTRVIGDQKEFNRLLDHLGVMTSTVGAPVKLLILNGGGPSVISAAATIAETLHSGGTVYWHAPTPEAFDLLARALGAEAVQLRLADSSVFISDRGSPLLDGISREDVCRTAKATGWDRRMQVISKASRGYLESRSTAMDSKFKSLTTPAALVTWMQGNGRVVIDNITWDQSWEGQADPLRFANGLLANLGAQFRTPL